MASHFAVQSAPTGVGSSAGGEVLAWVVARRSAAGGRRHVSLIFSSSSSFWGGGAGNVNVWALL